MNVARLLALSTGCLYPQKIFLVFISVQLKKSLIFKIILNKFYSVVCVCVCVFVKLWTRGEVNGQSDSLRLARHHTEKGSSFISLSASSDEIWPVTFLQPHRYSGDFSGIKRINLESDRPSPTGTEFKPSKLNVNYV
jgi:hypothetical protein